MAIAMDSRCVRSETGHYVFAAGAAPSRGERTEAQRMIANLRADLDERATEADPAIGQVVMMLHIAMQKPIVGPESAAVVEVWTKGLVEVPAVAIEAAYERFIQGRSGLSRSFMPKVPEFAGLARDIAAEWERTAQRLELILERREAAPNDGATLSKAGMQRLDAMRQRSGEVLRPMSEVRP